MITWMIFAATVAVLAGLAALGAEHGPSWVVGVGLGSGGVVAPPPKSYVARSRAEVERALGPKIGIY